MREKDLKEVLIEKQALERLLDFKFATTFWEEFCIAESYGKEGIVEHYNLVFDQWKNNLQYLTELVLVLNLKTFLCYKVDDTIGIVYDELWKKTDAYAFETLNKEELHYYLSALD